MNRKENNPLAQKKSRLVISNIQPNVEGNFAIKRIVGDEMIIQANIFTDGHDQVIAQLLLHKNEQENWQEIPLKNTGNDLWIVKFTLSTIGSYTYTIRAGIDQFATWQQALYKKYAAGVDIRIDIKIGLLLIQKAYEYTKNLYLKEWLESDFTEEFIPRWMGKLTVDQQLSKIMSLYFLQTSPHTICSNEFRITVDPLKARYSTWYEMFPRSSSLQSKPGTLRECEHWLPYIAKMGFDVLYLPPIHPIGFTQRKGKNNSTSCLPDDLGSPWAIGSAEGGHLSINPQLGTFEDFEKLIKKAKKFHISLALDMAFQCSPDHPYLKEHPNWFRWRPDHTLQFAENPPKKYEDIVPFDFDTEDKDALWEELKNVIVFWIRKGVTIFRIDNPHTKPFPFWEWLIMTIKKDYPHVLFLSEAFTRPAIMFWLAKIGFTQSYTYFAWRHTKKELTAYIEELIKPSISDFFRPNFWPNTPDILTKELQEGNQTTFMIRQALAATLSSNYGIYGPAFELMVQDALFDTEEYAFSEKYENKAWNVENSHSLASFIGKINRIRADNTALQHTSNIRFLQINNEDILCYRKFYAIPFNYLFIFVNLNAFSAQNGVFQVPLDEIGITYQESYIVQELLSGQSFTWKGEYQKINLNPKESPIQIFKIEKW